MFNKIYGIGGIGTGILFRFTDDNTLGREESRMATLTDTKDYCKEHIILHYISLLSSIKVYPVGYVGDDQNGKYLLDMMEDSGMDTRYVKLSKTNPTLYSVCFIYPNNDGGNITSNNSAMSLLSNSDINEIKEIKISKEDLSIIDEFLDEYYETFSAVYINSRKFLEMFK